MYTVSEKVFEDFLEAVHFAASIALRGVDDGVVHRGQEIVAIIRARK